ncbi:armadillo-type protein [Mycena rebaudengoi]|nr:armadillo-type protein [Mycena rebaudengoi]
MDKCIPANPDISGIGVRTAIYAQNILCFAPVIAHLWDGIVSREEIKGIKDQSIGMLAVAFAILISSIIEATTKNDGQALTSFHAAVILDLSWMNNTSTWIWFLLYAHHRTKPSEETEPNREHKRESILASWLAWTGVLLFPVRRLVTDGGKPGPAQRTGATFGRRTWDFVSQAPVLTLGSIHLSLMGGIGLWLWSNPSKFGTPIGPCDPTLTVVGGAVPFSSLGLRIFSLAIYCLLVIPGLNLLLPFLFFLALHITYNKSRECHPHFWERLEHSFHLIRHIPSIFQDFRGTVQHTCRVLRGVPTLTRALFRRRRSQNHDSESGIQLGDAPSGGSPIPSNAPPHNEANHTNETLVQTTPLDHTAFLIVGLGCLAVINIILLVDVELTLLRNKHNQSREEDDWGFGQVLALLLLVVPMRDFVTSILDIRKAKENIQRAFKEHLRQAVDKNTFDGHDFEGLIKRRADPNVELEGALQVKTLLQLAGSKGNEGLVQFLLDRRVEDTIGAAFHAAARHNQFGTALLLGKSRNESDRAQTTKRVVWQAMESLKDSDPWVRYSALECLSGVRVQTEFQQEIHAAIPIVVGLLKDSNSNGKTRFAAFGYLSALGAQAEFQQDIQAVIATFVEWLKESDSAVHSIAFQCLSGLGAQAQFQQEIRAAIPIVVKSLQNSDSDIWVRSAAFKCLSDLGAQVQFQQEIRAAIPIVVESLQNADSDSLVREAALDCLCVLGTQAQFQQEVRSVIPIVTGLLKDSAVCQKALECLSGLRAQVEFQQEIRVAIPIVAGLLKDPAVCQKALECLSGLRAQVEFQQEIRAAIPIVVGLLKYFDSYWGVRNATLKCLSGLGAQAEFQQEIRAAIPIIVELLKVSDFHSNGSVHKAALECLSGFGAQAEFQQEIRAAIPIIVESLKDFTSEVCEAAFGYLSGLGAQTEFQQEIRAAIPIVVKSLKDSDQRETSNSLFCRAALEYLSGLRVQAQFQQEIRATIPIVIGLLKDSSSTLSALEDALECLSGLGAQVAEFQQEIWAAIPFVVESLKDSDRWVHLVALECLPGLGEQVECQQDIRAAIPIVVELLKGSGEPVRRAALRCLSGLGAQAQFQQEIRATIPIIVESLKDEIVFRAALKCLSGLGAQTEFQQEIRAAIPIIVGWLKDFNQQVRHAALHSLSGLRTQVEFQQEIRAAIPFFVEWLKHDQDSHFRAALGCLSGLGAQGMLST